MKKQLSIFVTSFFLLTFSACSVNRQAEVSDKVVLAEKNERLAGLWRVEDIDQGGLIDFSMVTMQVTGNNTISGSTGCNRYSGKLSSLEGGFSVSKVITSRRACATAVSMQEQRFINALNQASSYSIEKNTWLTIKDASGNSILRLIEMPVQPAEAPESNIKLDNTSNTVNVFQCGTFGLINVNFLGPDTLSLHLNKQKHVLQRKVTASGAAYSNADIEFWNKGAKAMLTVSEHLEQCTKVTI